MPKKTVGDIISRRTANRQKLSHRVSEISNDHLLTAPTIVNPHTMVVKIRLARFGRRKAPFYNIVVAQARFVDLERA